MELIPRNEPSKLVFNVLGKKYNAEVTFHQTEGTNGDFKEARTDLYHIGRALVSPADGGEPFSTNCLFIGGLSYGEPEFIEVGPTYEANLPEALKGTLVDGPDGKRGYYVRPNQTSEKPLFQETDVSQPRYRARTYETLQRVIGKRVWNLDRILQRGNRLESARTLAKKINDKGLEISSDKIIQDLSKP